MISLDRGQLLRLTPPQMSILPAGLQKHATSAVLTLPSQQMCLSRRLKSVPLELKKVSMTLHLRAQEHAEAKSGCLKMCSLLAATLLKAWHAEQALF